MSWLEELKPGDSVVVNAPLGSESIGKVARVTKTMIVLDSGGRFQRSGFGGRIGRSSGFHRSNLAEATPEARDRIRHANLANNLRHVDWKTLSLETLEQVSAIWRKDPIWRKKEVSS